MTDTAPAPAGGPGPGGDVYTTLVRLVAGGIGEGIDRVMRVSAELDDADVALPVELVGPLRVNPTAMAAVGWVSELPRSVAAAGEALSRMSYPFVRVASVAIDTSAYVADVTGFAGFVAGLTEPTRTAIAEEWQRLTDVGTAEYARGRVLAVHAFDRSVDGIVGLLSESDELAELVREQTLGITGSAVQEIRETGAAADALTEGVFRRLLRRERRPMPPRLAEEA